MSDALAGTLGTTCPAFQLPVLKHDLCQRPRRCAGHTPGCAPDMAGIQAGQMGGASVEKTREGLVESAALDPGMVSETTRKRYNDQ